MVQSWYGGWNIWVYIESPWESHIVLLYQWLQNYFQTKEPIGREWSFQILQKARTANPSATTMLAVAQWQMSFLTRKHVQNISQIYGKNSWVFCQRSNQKKTRSTHPFEGASMPPVGEITLERMTDTTKPPKTLKPLKSKLPTRPYKKL